MILYFTITTILTIFFLFYNREVTATEFRLNGLSPIQKKLAYVFSFLILVLGYVWLLLFFFILDWVRGDL